MDKIFINDSILIPAIIQNEKTNEVLMLGYMNKLSFVKTKETGLVWFRSRRREKLWKKGETSGNLLKVETILFDCDKDTLLIKVTMMGKAVCHKGNKSCFSETL